MPTGSGALPPGEAAQVVLNNAVHHLTEPFHVSFVQNVYGAMLLSTGGLLSLLLGGGFPQISDGNPGFPRLLQGLSFPLGLVLVYFVGAELYTGFPMWYSVAALSRKGKPAMYVRSVLTSWVGNLLGALLATALFTISTEALAEEPWRSSIQSRISEDIIEKSWHIIFIRAVGCGWLVTVAMFLGNQNEDGISKALCIHFPFMIASVARYPHTVEYMYMASTGIWLGAPLTIGQYFWRCLLPITLGNTVGGSLFTGMYLWWIFLKGSQQGKSNEDGEHRHLASNNFFVDSD